MDKMDTLARIDNLFEEGHTRLREWMAVSQGREQGQPTGVINDIAEDLTEQARQILHEYSDRYSRDNPGRVSRFADQIADTFCDILREALEIEWNESGPHGTV